MSELDVPWNLNTSVFSRNKENMLDYKDVIVEKKDLVRALTSDIEENNVMEVPEVISKYEPYRKALI